MERAGADGAAGCVRSAPRQPVAATGETSCGRRRRRRAARGGGAVPESTRCAYATCRIGRARRSSGVGFCVGGGAGAGRAFNVRGWVRRGGGGGGEKRRCCGVERGKRALLPRRALRRVRCPRTATRTVRPPARRRRPVRRGGGGAGNGFGREGPLSMDGGAHRPRRRIRRRGRGGGALHAPRARAKRGVARRVCGACGAYRHHGAPTRRRGAPPPRYLAGSDRPRVDAKRLHEHAGRGERRRPCGALTVRAIRRRYGGPFFSSFKRLLSSFVCSSILLFGCLEIYLAVALFRHLAPALLLLTFSDGQRLSPRGGDGGGSGRRARSAADATAPSVGVRLALLRRGAGERFDCVAALPFMAALQGRHRDGCSAAWARALQ